MIDIHNHIIPNIDDGSDSLELSRELLLSAAQEGISDVCITPHFIKTGPYDTKKQQLLKRFADFKEACSDIPIKLYLGNELYIDAKLDELLEKDEVCTMNDSRYVLIEFPFFQYEDDFDEYLYNVSLSYQIIIAHPERYDYVLKNHGFVERWLKEGYLLQANSTSLHHHNTRSCIFHMIEKGQLSFIASDCHNLYRPLSLKEAYKLVSNHFSSETARLLMEENPSRILKDMEILPVDPVRRKPFNADLTSLFRK